MGRGQRTGMDTRVVWPLANPTERSRQGCRAPILGGMEGVKSQVALLAQSVCLPCYEAQRPQRGGVHSCMNSASCKWPVDLCCMRCLQESRFHPGEPHVFLFFPLVPPSGTGMV